jgi:hypothetical protein
MHLPDPPMQVTAGSASYEDRGRLLFAAEAIQRGNARSVSFAPSIDLRSTSDRHLWRIAADTEEHAVNRPERTFTTREIRVERHLPSYWRVTFDLPPVNIFGPKETVQLAEIITAIEKDEQLKVVVFDSAVDGFFITHYDFLVPLEDSARIPPGPTGLQALPDGPAEPSSGGVDRFHQGTRNGSRKRTGAGKRHAIRKPREDHSVSMGSRCGRRADGPITAFDGPRSSSGSAAERSGH